MGFAIALASIVAGHLPGRAAREFVASGTERPLRGVSGEVDAELRKRVVPSLGDVEAAISGPTNEPALVEQRAGERGSERARQMGAPLAPVETGECELPPALPGVRDVDTELLKLRRAGSGQLVRVATRDEHTLFEESIGEADAKAPGEVVVAGASVADRIGAVRRAERPCGCRHDQASERLKRVCDCGRGESVAPLTTGRDTAHHTAGEEERQVTACRARGHTGPRGELTGAMLATVHERVEHRCPSRVCEQSRHRCDPDAGHDGSIANRLFGLDRNVYGRQCAVDGEGGRMKDLEIALDHVPGALAAMGEVLGRAGVSVEGGGAFAVDGRGVGHFLFEDAAAARSALENDGIGVLAERQVLVQRLEQDRPGQLGELARRMAEAGVNIEVVYSDHERQLILVVDDYAKGRAVSDAWTRETDGGKLT